MDSRKLKRQHPCFPTHEEAKNDPSLVDSDHLIIDGEIPLDDANEHILRITARNTLDCVSFSGFNQLPADTDRDNSTKSNAGERDRYDGMMTGLAASVNHNNSHVLFLQETNEKLAEEFLKQKLSKHWVIKTIPGMLTAYDSEHYEEIDKKLDNQCVTNPRGLLSISLKHKKSNHIIDLHNMWGEYAPDEHDRLEKEYRALLNQSEKNRTVVLFGDTNSRIAPVDDTPRNITTGIVPTRFNEDFERDANHQISDFSDGGFYRGRDGQIKQINTRILDSKTGNPVNDTRTKKEISPYERQVRVLALDVEYDKDKEQLQLMLGNENSFASYQITSNSFNEKYVHLKFENEKKYQNFLNKFQSLNEDLREDKSKLAIALPRKKLKNKVDELSKEDSNQKNPWISRAVIGASIGLGVVGIALLILTLGGALPFILAGGFLATLVGAGSGYIVFNTAVAVGAGYVHDKHKANTRTIKESSNLINKTLADNADSTHLKNGQNQVITDDIDNHKGASNSRVTENNNDADKIIAAEGNKRKFS